MESLKIPKGRGSKPLGSIPFAIRYNADEGSLEDILKPCESFANSQPQNSEDFNWKKELLHVSFFNRKRSDSIEINPSPNVGTTGTLASHDATNVGTWKLIKGRVSQAMEDMKSSKPHQQTTSELNNDSETEDSMVQNSDNFLVEQNVDMSLTMNALVMSDESSQRKSKPLNTITIETESDSDLDFTKTNNLQSRVEIKSLKYERSSSHEKRSEKNKPLSASKNSSIRSTFLRKRKKVIDTFNKDDDTEERKHFEVESGVEVLEGMILPTAVGRLGGNKDIGKTGFQENYRDGNSEEQSVSTSTSENIGISLTNQQNLNKSFLEDHSIPSLQPLYTNKKTLKSKTTFRSTIDNICKNRLLIQTLALCFVILVLPLPDFFCGVVACLFTISLLSFITEFITKCIERRSCLNRPEKTKFSIPDYSSLPNCEIPSVEEHKPLKSYAGWMNEINNYDPANYHISMTRSVYVRLDGSRLRISNTMTRIPKRCMWNDPVINKTNITFAPSKSFDLTGCRIEMCPRGLARKRHFSRKYPIQLIIKNSNAAKLSDNCAKKNEIFSANRVDAVLATKDCAGVIIHQSSNESNEDRSESQSEVDFGTTLMNSNLQQLQTNLFGEQSTKENVPCGDETRLLLFARCDREKEDWYRRFLAASLGEINERELKIPDLTQLTEELTTEYRFAGNDQRQKQSESAKINCEILQKQDSFENSDDKASDENVFGGLIVTSCAARNPPEYIKFMSKHQKACSNYKISVIKSATSSTDFPKRHKRQKKQDDELWKGIDQSLYLGPAENVVWANVLIGRILFGCLNDAALLEKIQEFLQKKLNAIRLPSFMEDVVIAQVHLGDTPPLIHRISQPLLDERGVWIDADVTYEGLVHMTITTKLNLLRFKRQQQNQSSGMDGSAYNLNECGESIRGENPSSGGNCAIYDSNAESSGASSTESDSPTVGMTDSSEAQSFCPTQGRSRRLLRIVDRIAASNLFQSATEISYIQRAMENMTTKITLRVELKGLVSRVVVNLPPPPSDRIWIAFRGPPRLWISAKPAVGDHTVDWSIVTNVIESKLCDEVYKYLVYPNMVDIIAPFLGQPTYKE